MSRVGAKPFGVRARLAVALRLLGWSWRDTATILGCSRNLSVSALSRMRVPYALTAKQWAEHWVEYDKRAAARKAGP